VTNGGYGAVHRYEDAKGRSDVSHFFAMYKLCQDYRSVPPARDHLSTARRGMEDTGEGVCVWPV
jgi:hypothetical protein